MWSNEQLRGHGGL